MKARDLFLMTGFVLLVGCATSTPPPARQAPASTPASTVAPASTASSQVLTPVITTADDPRVMAANRYAREMGYKLVTRHGVQFYCRKTAPLGSRLEQLQCLTADGMAQAGQIADQNKNSWQQSHLCQGPGCIIG